MMATGPRATNASDGACVVTPDTVLVRARDVIVRLGDADNVSIMRGEDSFEATPHALAVLHAFGHPRTVADVLAVAASGPQHWIELSSTVLQLAKAGVLRAPGESDAAPQGFARPTIHVVMLDDEPRTLGYLHALSAVMKRGDVVVDIGTGTGVLATSAARAGAARVHAIESSAIADAAERVFEANGVSDRVSLVRGRSTQVTLPERADVLVTEIIGNDPLDELLLETVSDAKTRLLKPDARIVPCAIEILALPVDVPRRVIERHVFTRERIAAWRATYGMDLSALLAVRLGPTQPIMVRTEEVLSWRRVAPPVSLVAIDLTRPFDLVLKSRVSFVLEEDVERLGILLAFRATLAPGIVLSTLAEDVHRESSWRYALWPALDLPAAAGGTTAIIDYAYDRGTTTLHVS